MLIRLMEPDPKNNWLLRAECLKDPGGWTRFQPFHAPDSDRARFEGTVANLAAPNGVKLRKELARYGLSVFEYEWSQDEEAILEHALRVAETLSVELVLGEGRTNTAA